MGTIPVFMKINPITKVAAFAVAIASLVLIAACSESDNAVDAKDDPVNLPVPEPGTDGPPDTGEKEGN